jgi:hypothetical protein
MKPGHGEVLITEGDPRVEAEHERLVEEFRRQLDAGLWAAVPVDGTAGRRDSMMVRAFEEIPPEADRVIFFPRAAGGR